MVNVGLRELSKCRKGIRHQQTMKFVSRGMVRLLLLGLTILSTFLVLLWTCSESSFCEPRLDAPDTSVVVIPTSKLSRDAGDVLTNLLHSTVERQLIDGLLPVHPVENQSWSLWKSDLPDSPCSEYKTRFGTSMPRVWLLSFPRSGNTWTRYLLEAASGIFTGSVYTDRKLAQNGFLGEHDHPYSKRTLVQKAHGVPSYSKWSNDIIHRYYNTNTSIPTVLLLRNPSKSAISLYKYQKSKTHPEDVPDSSFSSQEFHDLVTLTMRQWMQLAIDCLLWTKAPLHVVYYELLVQDTLKELTSLLTFLGVPKDEGRLACIAANMEGSFKSKGTKPNDPFTNKEKMGFAAAAGAVNRTLQLLGYPPLPTYKYN